MLALPELDAGRFGEDLCSGLLEILANLDSLLAILLQELVPLGDVLGDRLEEGDLGLGLLGLLGRHL